MSVLKKTDMVIHNRWFCLYVPLLKVDVSILVVTEQHLGVELFRCLKISIWDRRFVGIFNTPVLVSAIYGIYWVLQQQLASQMIFLQ